MYNFGTNNSFHSSYSISDVLTEKSISFPQIHFRDNNFQLSLITKHQIITERTPFHFQLALQNHIYGSLDIIGLITFQSHENNTKKVVHLFGTFKSQDLTIKSADTICLHALTEFIQDHQIQFSFDISLPLILPGNSPVEQVPDLHKLIGNLIAPHDYDNVCPLSPSEIQFIITTSCKIISKQPPLLNVKGPVIVVGDLHGNFTSLLNIFKNYGFPETANYIFLGDYVDRGSDGADILLLLCAYKILNPNRLFLLRGNHEFLNMCSNGLGSYSFADECSTKKLDFTLITSLFEYLPIAAIIGGSIFCIHGGISPNFTSISQILNFTRPSSPDNGTIAEMLWSDPRDNIDGYGVSVERNSSFSFGPKAVKKFLSLTNMQLIIRGHQQIESGYAFPFGEDGGIVTLFSSASVEAGKTIKGAAMVIGKDLKYQFFVFNPQKTEKDSVSFKKR